MPSWQTPLKQQPGQNILVYGSGQLVRTLMEHDLADEYWLLVYPLVLGSGKRLFNDKRKLTLKLMGAKTLNSGVAALSYQSVQGK